MCISQGDSSKRKDSSSNKADSSDKKKRDDSAKREKEKEKHSDRGKEREKEKEKVIALSGASFDNASLTTGENSRQLNYMYQTPKLQGNKRDRYVATNGLATFLKVTTEDNLYGIFYVVDINVIGY